MSSRSDSGGANRFPTLDRTAVLRALVPEERRRVLTTVLDRPTPVGEWTLAERVAAEERGTSVEAVPESAATDVLVRLRQVHLPALADAGLVSWYDADAFVTPTDHPGLRDPLVLRLLRRSAADELVEAIADPRRRTAVAILQAESDPVSVDELAGELAARASDPATAVEDVTVSLRHVHLPKLAAAGLIDRDDGTVTYCGHAALDGPWFGWASDGRSNPRSPPGSAGDSGTHESD